MRAQWGGRRGAIEGLSEGSATSWTWRSVSRSSSATRPRNDPCRFVGTTCMVQFDDERAAAALGLLGELSRTTQVVLTHHARLAEIARRVVPGERLVEHELG